MAAVLRMLHQTNISGFLQAHVTARNWLGDHQVKEVLKADVVLIAGMALFILTAGLLPAVLPAQSTLQLQTQVVAGMGNCDWLLTHFLIAWPSFAARDEL